MRFRFALAVAAIAWHAAVFLPAAQAQDDTIDCAAFYKNPDGSWTATQPAFIPGTKLVSRVGGVFHPGVTAGGTDVVAALDKACPNPATSAAAPARALPPRVSLSAFADANGSIDITRLSCGHLADASDEEAGLLLAWYSRAATGPAKTGNVNKPRNFNLARLRFAIRNVVDYCKTHREQNLVQAMDQILR
jgi:hypothetical protein